MRLEALLGEASLVLELRGVVLPPELRRAPKLRRDPREPGRRQKEASQLLLFKRLRKFWRGQARRIKDAVEAVTPPSRKQAFDYLGQGFWDTEDDYLQAEVVPILQRMASNGIAIALEGINLGLDTGPTHQRAAAWARTYGAELVQGINESTKGVVNEAVAAFIETPGMTLGDVAAMLPYDEARAMTIATTETTRAYAEGNMEAVSDLREQWPGVAVTTTWFTNTDELVCEICEPLDGQTVDAEAGVFIGGDGQQYTEPPVHPNCRCWVDVGTDIRAE